MTTIHPAWLQKPARKPRGAAKPKPVPKPAATLRTCSECDRREALARSRENLNWARTEIAKVTG